MKKIYFATTNESKLKEARAILNMQIEPLQLDVPEIQTLDPIKCVEKKAEIAFSIAHKSLFVEDTTLFFLAWNGLPGVFVDYFMKSIDNDGLLKLLKNEKNRKAYAQTSLSYFDGKKRITVFGKVEGTISDLKRGTNGFGWDCIFIPKGKKKTFAEMTDDEKNSFSMRKLALEKLRKRLFRS